MVTIFNLFETKYLDYTFAHYPEKYVDLLKLFNVTDYSEKNKKEINSWFWHKNKNKDTIVKLYHGTSPDNDILNQGLLKTSHTRRHSYQSASGFVYLSLYPSMAKTFGDMGYGINNATVYEVYTPVEWLKPDEDQLNNVRYHSNPDVGNTMADSFLYGHGFRVAGNIPPYAIKINDDEEILEARKYLKWSIGDKVWAIVDRDQYEYMVNKRHKYTISRNIIKPKDGGIKFGQEYTIRYIHPEPIRKIKLEGKEGDYSVQYFTQDENLITKLRKQKSMKRFGL